MDFDPAEKMAVVNILHSVILADGVVHPAEIHEMQHLMQHLDFDSSLIQQARNLDVEQCLFFLKKLPQAKKEYLAQLLENVAKADGYIHEKEKDLLLQAFSAAGIGKVVKKST